MSTASINGITLHYEVHGSGEPLLLIAGYTCDSTMWGGILEKLTKQFQVIIFDNRGVGRSDAPSSAYSIEMMANDALGLLDKLGLKQAHVLGHSMGSAIAQTLAYQHPERVKKLILCNPLIKFIPAGKLAFRAILNIRKAGADVRTLTELSAPWVFSNGLLADPKNVDDLVAFNQNHPYPQSVAGQDGQFHALENFDSSAWFHKIAVPTLISGGEEDIITPLSEAKKLANGIRQSQLLPMPGAHVQVLEIPNAFSDMILKFLH